MTKLYLIGTIHQDLKGPERLEKFLNYVRPQYIGIEASQVNAARRLEDNQQIMSYLKKNESTLKDNLSIEGYQKFSQWVNMIGYEVTVPDKFSKNNINICQEYFDPTPENICQILRKSLRGDKVDDSGNLTADGVVEIVNMNLDAHQKEMDKEYQNDSVAELEQNPELFDYLLFERDKIIESKIRDKFARASNNFVYIGGLTHFFGNYKPNLYNRLEDLSPIRIRLKDMDSF